MENCTKNDLMRIEISIIRIKHEMEFLKKKIPLSYKNDSIYLNYKKNLEDKLTIQKEFDFTNYKKNCSEKEKIMLSNLERYSKLSLSEKELLSKYKYKYDFENDEMKLYTSQPIDSFITKEWKELQLKKSMMNIRDYYKDRDWS